MLRFLLLPSAEAGNGTGHIRRALRLKMEMQGGYRKEQPAPGEIRPENLQNQNAPGGNPTASRELPTAPGENHPAPEENQPAGQADIFIPEEELSPEVKQLIEAGGLSGKEILSRPEDLRGRSWDFSVWDRRMSRPEELRRWKQLATPIGLDEGGEMRKAFPFLIDTFPLPDRLGGANVSDPGFLPQPKRRRSAPPQDFDRILISFGGEDPAHLTEKLLDALLQRLDIPAERITVVLGPLFGERRLLENISEKLHILEAPGQLAELLHQYDLVFTSFGLTAYEALAAGCGVILLNPSKYHLELSRMGGFPELGVRKIALRRLRGYLGAPGKIMERMEKIRPAEERRLADLLQSLKRPEFSACPVCSPAAVESLEAQKPPAPPAALETTYLRNESEAKQPQADELNRQGDALLLRQNGRSFFRCRRCGMVYQLDFTPRGESYSRDYFFTEYSRQYGRSYLEDFEAIRAYSRRRLKHIGGLLPPAGQSLLDVGCAYGPFLAEAADSGYSVQGLDVVPEAVEYVRRDLGLAAVCSGFEDFEAPEGSFDIISMWFVIEHFADPMGAVKKAAALLRPGGVFAFSTPNLEGVSGRGRYANMLSRSPADHHTVWSPSAARRVLERAGFTVEKVVSTGHHPERFRLFPARRKGLWYRLRAAWSRIFQLGDTFEVYARKGRGRE